MSSYAPANKAVLRRPLEPKQYTSFAFTAHMIEAGIDASIGHRVSVSVRMPDRPHRSAGHLGRSGRVGAFADAAWANQITGGQFRCGHSGGRRRARARSGLRGWGPSAAACR
jgi:hypothetical protein